MNVLGLRVKFLVKLWRSFDVQWPLIYLYLYLISTICCLFNHFLSSNTNFNVFKIRHSRIMSSQCHNVLLQCKVLYLLSNLSEQEHLVFLPH